MFAHLEAIAGVTVAVTDRWGGVSDPPFDQLNLADHVGDDPEAVQANRHRLAVAIGVPPERLVLPEQLHGAEVAVVEEPDSHPPPRADALVTRRPKVALGVLVADCVPVMLADPGRRIVGVAHAGRQGLAAGVVPALLRAFDELGAGRIAARVGPSVCGRCYEVPAAMREEVSTVVPVSRARSWRGTPSLDIAAGVVDQLSARCHEIRWLPGCTVESDDLYSYRRDRTTGRFAGLVWMSG